MLRYAKSCTDQCAHNDIQRAMAVDPFDYHSILGSALICFLIILQVSKFYFNKRLDESTTCKKHGKVYSACNGYIYF